MPPQHVIGLTGNIASGKSTVAAILQELGAEVIDADTIAHEVLCQGTPETAAVTKRFGRFVLAADGAVDRMALGQIVFADAGALKDLEAIVHPGTRRRILERLGASRAAVVVVEAIKLLEGPLADHTDSIWVVTAPRGIRLERLTRERGLRPDQAEARIDSQNPESAKVGRADVVIENAGAREQLQAQVEAAWHTLIAPQLTSASAMGEGQDGR